MPSTKTPIIRENWSIFRRADSNGLYILALVNLNDLDKIDPFVATDEANSRLPEIAIENSSFAFDVNPKTMNLEEQAAVTIVPTQDGGQFIEHQGQIYKNIQISGTTGLRPNKGPQSLIPILALPNPFAEDTNDATGIPPKEITGFESFLKLRNLFRAYWDLKTQPSSAPYTLMVWQNGKEGEYYVVEPMVFRTNRESGSPLTFSYDIQLRTIERFEFLKARRKKDVLTEQNAFVSAVTRIRDAVLQVENSITTAEALIDRTFSVGFATINAVLLPASRIVKELSGFTGASNSSVSSQILSDIKTGALGIKSLLDDITVNPGYITGGITTQMATASHAYKEMMRGVLKLAGEDILISTPLSTIVSRKASAYVDPILGGPVSGGSPTNLGNISAANSAGQTVVNKGEDIYMIAQRLLGDRARWKELVLLNNLKPPYISPAPVTTNVLKPGDPILFPKSTNLPATSISNSRAKSVSTLDERLGTDIKLTQSTNLPGSNLFDLVQGINGDLDVVKGPDNLGQAITIRFDTESGELPTHPNYGGKFALGTKAKIKSLVEYNLKLRANLLDDRRIADIVKLKTTADGNVLTVKANLLVRSADQPLGVNFAVRG